MSRQRKSIVIFLCCIIVIVLFQGIVHVHGFFALNKPAPQKGVLVIEGWLPNPLLSKAAKEFHQGSYDYIVTSGISINKALEIASNARVFVRNIKDKVERNNSIEIEAYGSECNDVQALMTLFINSIPIDSVFVNKKPEFYTFNYSGIIEEMEVGFNNDAFNNHEDRNLYLSAIKINQESINIYTEGNYLDYQYQKTSLNYRNYAEKAACFLQTQNIPSEKIIPVCGKNKFHSRTFDSAIAVCRWLQTKDLTKKNINLVSMGVHARRSYMIYKNVLGKDFTCGVINIPSIFYNHEQWWKYQIAWQSLLKEFFAYFYTELLLLNPNL